MKKVILLIVLLSLVSSSEKAQIMFKLANDTLQAFNYSGGDEFSQNSLDENYWTNGLGWSRVLMSQDLAFSPKNVNLKDGLVNFSAKKEDSVYVLGPWEIDSALVKKEKLDFKGNKFLTKYSAGCIISKQKLHYGMYELRFKVEEGRGVWPAFWFFGGNKNEEIDAFELKCEQNNKVHVDTHCPSGCDRGYKDKFSFNKNWGGWLPVSDHLHKGFNIMHLEWTPEAVIWYMNGYPLAFFKGRFSNPMNLYLNTSVAKDGGPFKPGPDNTTIWPNTYSVDYFRIWKELKADDPIVLEANNTLTQCDLFEPTYEIKPLKKQGITYKKKTFETLEGMVFLSLEKSGKLIVRASGKLTQKPYIISILSGLKETGINTFKKETPIELSSSETELTLLIKKEGNTYQKRISVKW